MNMHGYPGCCGGFVITGFGYEGRGVPTKYNLEGIDREIKRLSVQGTGFITLTLTENQKRYYKRIVNKYGFKQVSKSNNGNTGRNLYTYIRVKRQHVKKRVKS